MNDYASYLEKPASLRGQGAAQHGLPRVLPDDAGAALRVRRQGRATCPGLAVEPVPGVRLLFHSQSAIPSGTATAGSRSGRSSRSRSPSGRGARTAVPYPAVQPVRVMRPLLPDRRRPTPRPRAARSRSRIAPRVGAVDRGPPEPAAEVELAGRQEQAPPAEESQQRGTAMAADESGRGRAQRQRQGQATAATARTARAADPPHGIPSKRLGAIQPRARNQRDTVAAGHGTLAGK